MREKRKGYPVVVSIGYKRDTKSRGKIQDKQIVIIRNTKDLEKIKKNQISIIGKIGKKKKIEIAEKAKEKKIQIYNLNTEKFLKKKIKPKEEKKKWILKRKKRWQPEH